MNNKARLILSIFIISLVFAQNFSSINPKITPEQKRMLSQAKSLESSGLIDEAIIAYKNILLKFPTFKEAFIPLKNIYIKENDLNELKIAANKYLSANKFSINSKIDILDIFILTDNPEWDKTAIDLYNSQTTKLHSRKKILSILLKFNKENLAYDLIKETRKNVKTKGFYSLELGMYFALKFNYKSAVQEYLVYLENNQKNIRLITQRIMLLADNLAAIEVLKMELNNSKITESKIILSKLEFKLKNYNQSFEILKNTKGFDKYKLELSEDLIKIKNFTLAHKIIDNILDSSKDNKMLNLAISQLANLYELETIEISEIFPISKNIYKNQILNSPFIKINTDNSDLLLKAINIYDSLSTYGKDYKSMLNLADVKYRVYKDLDGAEKIYKNLLNQNISSDYKHKIISDLVNISFSRGNLDKTFTMIDSLYNNIINPDLIETIDLKKIQAYYYNLDKDSLIINSEKLLKSFSKENLIYNDLLSMNSLFSFYDTKDLENYVQAQFKIIQDKRNESINMLDSIKIDNNIYSLSKYESAYLEILEKNYQKALEKISDLDSIEHSYKERSLILKGEIYDYGLNDKSMAVDTYLNFIDLYPKSIFYDIIRLRLRELAL